MEKTAQEQLVNIFSEVTSNDFFEISSSIRHQRMVKLFQTLKSLKIDINRNKGLLESCKQKWKALYEQLCDIQTNKELLGVFLTETFIWEDEYFDYCIKILQLVFFNKDLEGAFFKKLEDSVNKKQLIRAIRDNSHKLPNDISFRYLHTRVLQAIFFSYTTDEERKQLCELILAYPMGFAVQFMDNAMQKQYKQDVLYKYVKFIQNRCRDDWSLICKTIIHYSGRLLHTDTHLQNVLLKIVEEAFKNSNIEGKCDALDCWRVLIDNYSLDNKYLTNPKQANLLLKPLRARISRSRNVTMRKFDTYTHFIIKMDFVKDQLERFLTDVFGPFDVEVTDSCKVEFENITCFRELNSIYAMVTEILLKVIGHNRNECGCNKKTFPVTNIYNIPHSLVVNQDYNWDVLVDSVRICSQLNYNQFGDVRREVVVKCLWSSIFKHINLNKYQSQLQQVLRSTQLAISKVLNSSYMNHEYYDNFFKIILKCMVEYLTDIGFNKIVHEELVLPTIKELIMFQDNYLDKLPVSVYHDYVLQMCIYCEKELNFFNTIDYLVQYGPYKCQLASDVFTFAVGRYTNALQKGLRIANDETLKVLMANIVTINCYKHIETSEFERVYLLIQHKSTVLIDFFTLLLNNDPTLIFGLYKMAVTFLRYVITVSAISDQKFYNFLLDIVLRYVINLELSKPDLEEIKADTHILEECLSHILRLRRQQSTLCIDIVKILEIYYLLIKLDHFDLLNSLSSALDFAAKEDISEELYNLIVNLTDYPEEISQKAFDVFAKMHAKGSNRTLMTPKQKLNHISEAAPITPKSKSVRLFGKYFESPSPKRRRSCEIQRAWDAYLAMDTPSPSTTNSTMEKHIDGLSESAFVLIDKKVVVDKDKLTEHQKEFVSGDHIPALYSELTQSRSVDGESTKKSLENGPIKDEPPTNFDEEGKKHAKQEIATRRRSLLKKKVEGIEQVERKRHSEITKLTMNIVGEDEYFNLPRVRSRKSRAHDEFLVTPEAKRVAVPTKKAEASMLVNHMLEDDDDIAQYIKQEEKFDTDMLVKEEKLDPDFQLPGETAEDGKVKDVKKVANKKRDSDEGTRKKKRIRKRDDKVKNNDAEVPNKSARKKSTEDAQKNIPEGLKDLPKGKSSDSSGENRPHKKKNRDSDQKKRLTKKKDDHGEHKNPKGKKKDDDDGDNSSQNKNNSTINENKVPTPSESKIPASEEKNDSNDTKQDNKDDDSQNTDQEDKPPIISETESENIIPSSQEYDLRVQLYRLPSLSPTKKELEEAKLKKEKMEVSVNSGIVTKINFDKELEEIKGIKSFLPSSETTDARPQTRRSRNRTISAETPPKPVDETLTLEVGETILKETATDLDTMSLLCTSPTLQCIQEESTPLKLKNCMAECLQTSPVTNDTPSRTKELMDSTIDLSPIQLSEKTHISPDLFTDGADSNSFDVDDHEEILDEMQVELKTEEVTTLKNPSSRSAKLLNLIGQPSKLTQTRLVVENARVMISSPTTDRVRKMMLNCSEANKTDEDDQVLEKLNPDDVLEFCNRPVPSPMALPRSSILKRKFVDSIADDTVSPIAKRKRVNFPDPPTTCQMVYFKILEEKEDPEDKPSLKKKRGRTRLLAGQITNGAMEKELENGGLEDASDAIQSMQNQIDGLDNFEGGVIPLETSPAKDTNANGRILPLPSNPPPELLGFTPSELGPVLFPSEESIPETENGDTPELTNEDGTGGGSMEAKDDDKDEKEKETNNSDNNEGCNGGRDPSNFLTNFCSGLLEHIRLKENLETYVKFALQKVPDGIIEKYMAERKISSWDFETYVKVHLENVPVGIIENYVAERKLSSESLENNKNLKKRRGRPRRKLEIS